MRVLPLVLALAGCGLEQEAAGYVPKSFVVPLLHWHFPLGLSKETPYYFPYSLPPKE